MFGLPRSLRLRRDLPGVTGAAEKTPDRQDAHPRPETPGQAQADQDALTVLLEDIEKTALEVYGLHGLPTVRGHYGRSPRARKWRFLDNALTAEERFALVLANPQWRFSTLETIGRQASEGAPDLAVAADLLAGCAAVRGELTADWLLDASQVATLIRLGADWRLMEGRLARQRSGPLKLTFAPGKPVGGRSA